MAHKSSFASLAGTRQIGCRLADVCPPLMGCDAARAPHSPAPLEQTLGLRANIDCTEPKAPLRDRPSRHRCRNYGSGSPVATISLGSRHTAPRPNPLHQKRSRSRRSQRSAGTRSARAAVTAPAVSPRAITSMIATDLMGVLHANCEWVFTERHRPTTAPAVRTGSSRQRRWRAPRQGREPTG
jgi:hypothetical protein